MEQGLNLERLVAVVADDERRVEALAVERNAVQQAELVRPQLARRVVEVLRREAKVELDAGARGAFARGLAEELPPSGAGEAVLWQLGRRGVVWVRRAESLEIRPVSVCQTSIANLEAQGGLDDSPRTGKTRGMPPRTPLVPSSLVFSLSHSFSSPEASFQLSTVAPKSSTSTLSPVGSVAVTRELPWEMLTWAWGGRPGVAASADGLFGLSTILLVFCVPQKPLLDRGGCWGRDTSLEGKMVGRVGRFGTGTSQSQGKMLLLAGSGDAIVGRGENEGQAALARSKLKLARTAQAREVADVLACLLGRGMGGLEQDKGKMMLDG